ncbi:hypothetical protein GWK47_018389 [Chionoecetes opilio]|uniref:Uncharacterized protein n=1 Tax=Chionoecetes opilio TaxID=41210 RepID=A0A8J4XQI2_CHIOP|nr:hypothetical protein GWK47_018389 [Chionoecetes opilio]
MASAVGGFRRSCGRWMMVEEGSDVPSVIPAAQRVPAKFLPHLHRRSAVEGMVCREGRGAFTPRDWSSGTGESCGAQWSVDSWTVATSEASRGWRKSLWLWRLGLRLQLCSCWWGWAIEEACGAPVGQTATQKERAGWWVTAGVVRATLTATQQKGGSGYYISSDKQRQLDVNPPEARWALLQLKPEQSPPPVMFFAAKGYDAAVQVPSFVHLIRVPRRSVQLKSGHHQPPPRLRRAGKPGVAGAPVLGPGVERSVVWGSGVAGFVVLGPGVAGGVVLGPGPGVAGSVVLGPGGGRASVVLGSGVGRLCRAGARGGRHIKSSLGDTAGKGVYSSEVWPSPQSLLLHRTSPSEEVGVSELPLPNSGGPGVARFTCAPTNTHLGRVAIEWPYSQSPGNH